MSQNLSRAFERAIKGSTRGASVDRVDSRSCSDDNYDGIEYKIYGGFVPVRPVIDVVVESDGHAIAELYHCADVEEPYLGLFVVELPEETYPGFVQ